MAWTAQSGHLTVVEFIWEAYSERCEPMALRDTRRSWTQSAVLNAQSAAAADNVRACLPDQRVINQGNFDVALVILQLSKEVRDVSAKFVLPAADDDGRLKLVECILDSPEADGDRPSAGRGKRAMDAVKMLLDAYDVNTHRCRFIRNCIARVLIVAVEKEDFALSIFTHKSNDVEGKMAEDSEEFQDFSSGASDFDDDVDWGFTDGESASVLQLMGEVNSIKKAQLNGIDATPVSTSVNSEPTASNELSGAGCITTDAVEAQPRVFSDEDLLNELFPETKPELTTKEEKPAEPQVEKRSGRNKEFEVEWALMALEEHEQLGQKPCSTSSASGDADFVSLFEEMYGGDTAIALSTPSPPAKSSRGRQDKLKEPDETEAMIYEEVCSPLRISDDIDERMPTEALNMLRLVYAKATEMPRDFSPLLSDTRCKLCLPDQSCQVQLSEPLCSFDSLLNAVCSFEESLNSQQLVNSIATTREERLELVLVALDDKVGALPQSMTVKWVKMIDMLPLLVKMMEQSKPSIPASNLTDDQPSVLEIDTMPSPPAKPKDKEGSPLKGWATFHPERMPARRSESMKTPKPTSRSKQTGQSNSTKRPRVQIRQFVPTKLRVRCKVYNPEDSELTFQPKINKKYSHQRKGEPKQQKENFTVRMEKDIYLRRSQKLQHEQEREQHDREESENVSAVKLIAKGSEQILLRNGMWAESFEERLHRLAKHRINVNTGDSRSKKRRQRLEQRKREATAVASRACESLYQRGIDQRNREQERLQEVFHDLEFQRNRPKMSSRSLKVMKTRIRQELSQLCADSLRTSNAEALDDEVDPSHNDSAFVTFIQFSCTLLYFGFVADLNTPWEGGEDNEITLLWHSWTVFTRDDTAKLAIKVLERVLFSVILGRRAGDHSVLQGRGVQTLLRLYRANYYARKHTQLKSEPSVDRVQNDTTAGAQHTREGQTKTRGSSRRQRIHYSLHGKPIRSHDTPETDLLIEREQLLQEKMDQMREAKAKQELEGCTFHPNINPGRTQAAVLHRTSPSQSPKSSSATVSTFERLYSDAFQRQNNVLEKYLEAKLRREELEKLECRVHPSYVNGLTIEERLENLHVALAGSALPVDFHKKIDAMRTATEMKALDEQLKEQRLLPTQFKRAQDGRTIVLPFKFATEIRAGLSTELKKQRTKASHRPRDHMMKVLRPLAEEEEREIPTLAHPPRKFHEDATCVEDQEADLCLDVHLSPSETHQLFLNLHDDPHEVVERFAQRFSLTNTQRHFLVQLVEARLEQFTNLQV